MPQPRDSEEWGADNCQSAFHIHFLILFIVSGFKYPKKKFLRPKITVSSHSFPFSSVTVLVNINPISISFYYVHCLIVYLYFPASYQFLIMPKETKRNRHFQIEWEDKYLVSLNKSGNLECLICNKIFNAFHPTIVKRHFLKHVDSRGPFSKNEKDEMLHKFKTSLDCSPVEITHNKNACLHASYQVSLNIAKNYKCLTEGEFVKKCALDMANAFNNNIAKTQFESVPLSARTVSRRISSMSTQISNSLREILTQCKYFSLCLDESTDIQDVSQLLIFVRCVSDDFSVHEELLDIVPLHGTTKGIDIYNAVNSSVQKYKLDFNKCSAIVTDGAKAMVGKKIGFLGQLRKNNINVPVYHCIIHQEVLCSKFLKLSDTMRFVTNVTNLIRGGNRSHSHRAFQYFLEEVNAVYPDLLLHSDIRWLSAGKSLTRFFALRKELSMFLRENVKADTTDMEEKLKDAEFLRDLAFLTDITVELNNLNLKLQGRNQGISHLVKHVESFQNRLQIYKDEISDNDVSRFPSCSELKNDFPNLSFNSYESDIDKLVSEFDKRFKDFVNIKNDIYLFNDPRKVVIKDQRKDLMMELCDLQADNFLALDKEVCQDFYKKLSVENYPLLRDFGLKMFSMFGSTYVCESSFSAMNIIKSKQRNSLTDDSLSHLLRLSTTNIQVDIESLVNDSVVPDCSH